MRSLKYLQLIIILLFIVSGTVNGESVLKKDKSSLNENYVSLKGKVQNKGNPHEVDGNIHKINAPLLHLMRTKSSSSNGIILLLPGGDYELLKLKNESETVAGFLNDEGYDVAILEYHISKDLNSRDLAMADLLKALKLIKTSSKTLGLHGDRLSIIGISSGGHLAARTVQKLDKSEQPDNLLLVNPACMNENITGTVFPAIIPPVNPAARLLCISFASDNKDQLLRCEEYSKIWKGYDGTASFNILQDSLNIDRNVINPIGNNLKLRSIITTFLKEKPEKATPGPNPAAIPVAGSNTRRHNLKLALVAKDKFDLLFVGNSITNNFESPRYQPVWNQFFAPRKAINLGYSGYRTENIIWNIQNGELEGQSPKVIILEIGTNNVDEKHYPTRHTAGQLAGGIEAIVNLLREKCPNAKIIVLRCFPGSYDGPNPTSHRAILDRASEIVSKLADGKYVFYCDVNKAFLNKDGSINHELMPDWLHPSPAGAKAWAQAMEPLLSKLMGDKSLDTETPSIK